MRASNVSIPASFFGIAVGLLALANAWRVGVRIWQLPKVLADMLTLGGLLVWLLILALYIGKWLWSREAALAELQHPIQSSFLALGPVSSLLAAGAVLPYSHPLSVSLFVVAVAIQIVLGLWLYGRFWQGHNNAEMVTPAIYLPAVAQNFVAGTTAAALGWQHLGSLFFGAGMLSWLAIESILLNRNATHGALPTALRPLLGIQLAPPVVAGVTYLGITNGPPDLFAEVLLGYGLYQALLLIRLLPWIGEQKFAPSYWAFSFGAAALPTMAMRMLERGAVGPAAWLAPALFVASNVVFGALLLKTFSLMLQGSFLPVASSRNVSTN